MAFWDVIPWFRAEKGDRSKGNSPVALDNGLPVQVVALTGPARLPVDATLQINDVDVSETVRVPVANIPIVGKVQIGTELVDVLTTLISNAAADGAEASLCASARE